MITNPSCQNDGKDPEQKFHAQNFDEELTDIGSGGASGGAAGGNQAAPPAQLTDLSGKTSKTVIQPKPQL